MRLDGAVRGHAPHGVNVALVGRYLVCCVGADVGAVRAAGIMDHGQRFVEAVSGIGACRWGGTMSVRCCRWPR